MTIQEQITSDQQAVEAAQATLDAAHGQLAKDQAALDALQPHLSVLEEMKAEAEKIEGEAGQAFHFLIAKMRSLFNV